MSDAYKITDERIEEVRELAKMFSGAEDADTFDADFIEHYGCDIEEICVMFIRLTNRFDTEINTVRGKKGFGRGAIRTTYDADKRKELYAQATSYAKKFSGKLKKDCKELQILLDKVTDVYVHYIRAKGNLHNPETPMFIRGIIGMTAYYMLDTARKVTIIATGESLVTDGFQSYIISYMQKRAKEVRGMEIFGSGRKIFTKSWNMPIKKMYDEGCIYAPEVPFDYAGHKDDILGYIVREMLEQLDKAQGYTEYADVYGGSGRAILQFPLESGKKYHINDLHPYNVALWNCLKDDKKYKELLEELDKQQSEYMQIQVKIDKEVAEHPADIFKDKALYGNLETLGIQEFIDLNNEIHTKYDVACNRYILKTQTDDVKMATDFVILHSFLNQGTPVASLSSGINMFRNLKGVLCSWVYERDFKGIKSVYQNENVILHNYDDLTMIRNLPNRRDVIMQLDPPYIFTKNYANSSFTLKDMINLMDSIKRPASKRMFIYHCQTIYNYTASRNEKIKNAFREFMGHWNTFEERLFVTFIVKIRDGVMPNCTDEELMNIYISNIASMRNQKDVDDEYATEEPDEASKKKKKKSKKENPEIIITNFEVSISSRYHIQGYFNPYSVLLSNTTSDGTDFKVVTVPMKDYLDVLLSKI